MNKQQLASTIWQSANQMRSKIEANEYKDYILGYGMIAKSFSTEFGKPCIWFEDLYLKQEFRGKGIIPKFMQFIENTHRDAVFRLEVEQENAHACYIYKKLGFEKLPYSEMIKR